MQDVIEWFICKKKLKGSNQKLKKKEKFLKNLAIKQQKSLIKRHIEMLKDKNDFDHTMKYYSRSFVNSVHKDELDLMLQEIIDENIIE